MLLIHFQILDSQSLARQAVMAPSNKDQNEGTATLIHDKLPYIITEASPRAI